MKTRELTRIALMGTILYVVFQAFSDILYLEMITFTILAFSQVFTRRETVLSCLLFAAVHLLLHGIMFWNIAYLIIFPAYGLLFSSCRGFLSRHPGCIPFYGAFFSFLTGQLVDLIKSAMPPQALREKQHPAKRSFQALRIAVNGELEELTAMLRGAASRLAPGGRLAVITFHSLEDRIVKKTMQELATGCTCPPNFPVCVCGKKPTVRLVNRKPIVCGPAELTYNPRARSAKLRVAEKL